VRFLDRLQKENLTEGRLGGTLGLHASLTLSDATSEACKAATSDGAGFHIHVAEHEADEYDSLEKSNLRVVDRLLQHGILGEKTIVAHAVHVDAREVEILKDAGTWVTHQLGSNMNNTVGTANVDSLMRTGVRLGLGNDGSVNAMWEECKTAYLLQKLANRDPRRLPGAVLVEIAMYDNRVLAHLFFPGPPLGVIEKGASADLIFVDHDPTTPFSAGNLPWHIIYRFHESMITATIVAG
jgi:cytosine/adenosine deaminase-related metal-dependent hydrolase